jgi:Holliday junction DNA helicase RuvA
VIGSLKGTLEEVDLGESVSEIVVDVAGVGYVLSVPTRTALDVGPVGAAVKLAVHTHLRDTGITLYGFGEPAERRCFEVLVATNGVGPALALAILGVHRPADLARVVASGDEAALTDVPGVGRKTAARLLVELGSRVEELAGGALAPAAGVSAGRRAGLADAVGEVGEALAALGYAPDEVRPVLQSLPAEERVEELLRLALRQLAARR